jgi:uncharacterized protein YjiS (DUF1127 family)
MDRHHPPAHTPRTDSLAHRALCAIEESTTMITTASSTLLSIVRGGIVRAARGVRDHIACRDLYTMPDHVLKDIGIPRGAIEHAVRHGRGAVPGRPGRLRG